MQLKSPEGNDNLTLVCFQPNQELVFEETQNTVTSLEEFRQLSVKQMTMFVKSGVDIPTDIWERLQIFLMLARFRTAVPSLLCYALGFSYSGAEFSIRMVLGAFIIFVLVCLSNLANTYTDIEEDCNNLPGRVYLLAKFGYGNLFQSLIALNLFTIAASATLNIYALIVTVLSLFFVNQYSFPPFRMKAHPFWGLFAFAQAVVFPFLLGGVTQSGTILQALLSL